MLRSKPMEIPHPKLRDLYELWERKRAGRPMPARAEIDVLELSAWIGQLMLVEVGGEPSSFRYRVYGTSVSVYHGRDLTGRSLDELPVEVRESVRREYAEVCARRAPVLVRQQRVRAYRTIELVKLMLPLSTDGITVDGILAGVYPEPGPAGQGEVIF